MPVSGVVLTLVEDRSQREAVLRLLHANPNIQVGDINGHRLSIVVDTPSSDDDAEAWEYLNQMPGVRFVDLVCVQDFEVNGVCHESIPH